MDSHTPWLWDGEEFLRSADYWTHGYDLYSPSRIGNVLYHNYSKKPASFWESPYDPAKKALEMDMTHNRVRLRVGIDFKGPVDGYELNKYKFGTARSFEQYMRFANMSFEGMMNETNSCGQLHWVPYANASEVEVIVGGGWRMRPGDAPAPVDRYPTPQQHVPSQWDDYNESPRLAKHVAREMFEDEAEDVFRQRALSAHEKNGAGIGDVVQLRKGSIQSPKPGSSNMSAWGLLGVVLVALFVTLSNDSKSRAIRRSCVSRAHHLSHD